MNRSRELLIAAVEALEQMRDPFEISFLIEHGVTLDECGDLSDQLAFGGRLVLQGKNLPAAVLLAAALAPESNPAD